MTLTDTFYGPGVKSILSKDFADYTNQVIMDLLL